MFKLTLWITALLLPVCLLAQPDTTGYKNTISIAPLRLIDPDNSGVELAFEHRHNPARSTQLIAAYMTPAFSKQEGWRNYNGFRLGIDQRFYSVRSDYHLFGVAGFVVNKTNFLNAGTYVSKEDSTMRFDTVHLHKTNLIFNLTYGVQTALFRRVALDISTGIGLKYRQVKQEEPGWLLGRNTDWYDFESFFRAGHTWTVTFPFIVRLGYRF